IGCNLPSLQDLYASRTLRRAGKIMADPSHPRHKLLVPLPSARSLRSIRTKTSRHLSSFFPSAVGLINKARDPRPPTRTLIPPPHLHPGFCYNPLPCTMHICSPLVSR